MYFLNRLSTNELEKFCTLQLSESKSAVAAQRKVAAYLATLFENGGKRFNDHGTVILRDKWKALKYKRLANLTNTKKKFTLFTTKHFHHSHSWYTAIRVFLIQLEDLLKNNNKGFLPHLFKIAGLSYGVAFLLDVFFIGDDTFRAPAEGEKQLSRWQRFKNALKRDNRIDRMGNNALWFTINFLGFILTGGASAIINIGGAFIDLCLELYNGIKNIRQPNHMLHEISKEEARDQKMYSDLSDIKSPNKSPDNKPSDHVAPPASVNEFTHQRMNTITEDLDNLKLIESKLKREQKFSIVKTGVAVLGATCVLAGSICLLFPPAWIPGAALIGSGIAFLGGTVLGGLGRKLWNKASSYFSRNKDEKGVAERAEVKTLNNNTNISSHQLINRFFEKHHSLKNNTKHTKHTRHNTKILLTANQPSQLEQPKKTSQLSNLKATPKYNLGLHSIANIQHATPHRLAITQQDIAHPQSNASTASC